ncbi:MAG: twin-arginine translocation signal domain-containing protein, partial [Candidatus Thiodiazotropha sp. (ex Lucinoma borealis)]|nr:twin-arginine translocation signal domain-containing protein [Candidatus Thiodiazotropha sp. (ex Lucinoma borealis)]
MSVNDPITNNGGRFRRPVSHHTSPSLEGVCLTRRRFVQGLAMGGAVAGLGL